MIILTGKSCSGKTTVASELCKLGYSGIVGYTTRPPREGEVEGDAYHFITQKEFLKKVDDGFFAESRSFHAANGQTWYYGTALEDLGPDKVAVLNPHGTKMLKKIPEIVPVVFYLKVDDEIIRDRLEKRDKDMAEAARRMKSDLVDFCDMEETADFVLRNDAGLTPRQLAENISGLYEEVLRQKELEMQEDWGWDER